jgi:hypothetical protein
MRIKQWECSRNVKNEVTFVRSLIIPQDSSRLIDVNATNAVVVDVLDGTTARLKCNSTLVLVATPTRKHCKDIQLVKLFRGETSWPIYASSLATMKSSSI